MVAVGNGIKKSSRFEKIKGFEFLFNGTEPEYRFVQVFNDWSSMKFLLLQAVEHELKASVFFPGDNSINAVTNFVKLGASNKEFFIVMDAMIPRSSNRLAVQMSRLVITYEIDHVPVGFSTAAVKYDDVRGALILAFPNALYRLQRRQHFRLEVMKSENLVFSIYLPDGTKAEFPVRNISESGAAFLSNYKPEDFVPEKEEEVVENTGENTGENVEAVNTEVPEIVEEKEPEPIVVDAELVFYGKVRMPITIKIIHSKKTRLRKFKYIMGVDFTNINPTDEATIANYLFKKQREELMKRKRISLL